MKPQTDTVNTHDWLEATKDLVILPYIESYMPSSSLRGRPWAEIDHSEELRRVSAPYKGKIAVNAGNYLNKEFQVWDDLSDEALMNFETELG